MPHTPGPWVAQRDWESVFSPDPEELDYYMKRPITVIRSLTADKNVASCHDLFEFNPDDARLIAAAPELLEALEDALEKLRIYEEGVKTLTEDEPEFFEDYVAVEYKALAAIAKAKGE